MAGAPTSAANPRRQVGAAGPRACANLREPCIHAAACGAVGCAGALTGMTSPVPDGGWDPGREGKSRASMYEYLICVALSGGRTRLKSWRVSSHEKLRYACGLALGNGRQPRHYGVPPPHNCCRNEPMRHGRDPYGGRCSLLRRCRAQAEVAFAEVTRRHQACQGDSRQHGRLFLLTLLVYRR